MPNLPLFPKHLCRRFVKMERMTVSEWIELAVQLDIDGLEWYAGFLKWRMKATG